MLSGEGSSGNGGYGKGGGGGGGRGDGEVGGCRAAEAGDRVMVEKLRWALLLSSLQRSYDLKDKSQLLSSTKCFMIELLLTSLASLPANHTHTNTLSSSTLEYFLSLRPSFAP